MPIGAALGRVVCGYAAAGTFSLSLLQLLIGYLIVFLRIPGRIGVGCHFPYFFDLANLCGVLCA
ncbi:MAG: hypothetical protein WCO14_05370 [bacterium]